jgi:hypothetical protein
MAFGVCKSKSRSRFKSLTKGGLYIPLDLEDKDEDNCSDILPSHMTNRRCVRSGARHALLTRRNTLFECRIGGNTKAIPIDSECMDKDHVDDNTPLP